MNPSVFITRTLCLLAFGTLTAAAADPAPAQAVKFEQLAKTVTKGDKPVFPEELRKLDGKRVRLTGFVAPYDDPEKMTKFLLTKAAVGCFFCNPPDENGVVLVRRGAKDKPLKYDSDSISVEGTLHLTGPDAKDEEAQQFLFTLDDATVVKK